MKIKERSKNTQTGLHGLERLLEFNSFTLNVFGQSKEAILNSFCR